MNHKENDPYLSINALARQAEQMTNSLLSDHMDITKLAMQGNYAHKQFEHSAKLVLGMMQVTRHLDRLLSYCK